MTRHSDLFESSSWKVEVQCGCWIHIVLLSIKTYVEQPNPNLNRYKYLTDFRLCQKNLFWNSIRLLKTVYCQESGLVKMLLSCHMIHVIAYNFWWHDIRVNRVNLRHYRDRMPEHFSGVHYWWFSFVHNLRSKSGPTFFLSFVLLSVKCRVNSGGGG